MFQVLTQYLTVALTAVATTATRFADNPSRIVYITNNSGGNLWIGGASSTSGDAASNRGILIADGQVSPPLWVDNTNKLSYFAAVSGAISLTIGR